MGTRYDTLVFDFNGTLVDDVERCLDLLNEMLAASSHPPVSRERYLDIFTFPIIEYYRQAGFRFKPEGEDDFPKLAAWFTKEYVDGFPSLSLFPDALTTLRYFHGKKRLILLSATQSALLLQECETLGIDGYFDAILGIEDIYAHSKLDVGRAYFAKHSEDIDPCRTLFIGDTLHDKEVGEALGGDVLIVHRGHQSLRRLKEGGAKNLLPDLASLLKLEL